MFLEEKLKITIEAFERVQTFFMLKQQLYTRRKLKM